MTNLKAKTGSKEVTIKKGQNGYGDVVYNASLTQSFNNGIETETRLIEMKSFLTENKAVNWAEKQLSL
jgi:hypothetical protein